MSVARPSGKRGSRPGRCARTALEALNFVMADMQAGIGPFLGVFLQQRGWATGASGPAAMLPLYGLAAVAAHKAKRPAPCP